MLRGAVTSGALLWATPVVQTLNATAWAATGSFPGTGFSELAVVLRKGTKYYRVKYEFSGNSFVASSNAAEPIDNACGGKIFPRTQKYTSSYLLASSTIAVPDAGYREGSSFRLALASGVSMVAYFVHQGSCCTFYESPVPGNPTTPPALPSVYKGCTIDYVPTATVASTGTLVTFPPAFNRCKDAC